MENEPKQPEEQNEPKPAENEPKPAEGQGGTDPDEGVKDSHGQPGINKERHDREVEELNNTIAELQAKVDEAAKTDKAREDLKKEIQAAKEAIEAEKLAWKLEKAGCRNVKAAKALLEDHDNDVDKLKAAEPWLFEEDKPKGSTGLKPVGAPDGEAEALARMRRAAGLPDKK